MKVLWNDGEGLLHTDLELARDLNLRHLWDSICANLAAPDQVLWGTATARQTEEMRPLRNAGIVRRASASSVEIFGGLWLRMNYATALSADGPTAILGHADAKDSITGIAAAAAGQYRRDLIQVRMTSVDDATASRDFKDAVTGALSSQSLVKRNRSVIEYGIKTGTEHGDITDLHNDVALEPSPDAGWFKLCSIGVDDAGVTIAAHSFWDHRKPWGYLTSFVDASDWWDTSGYSRTSTEDRLWTGAVSAVYAWLNFDRFAGGPAAYQDFAPYRIETLQLHDWDLTGAPAAADFIIGSGEISPTAALLGWDIPGTGLGASIPAGASVYTAVYDSATMKPLWSNGRSHPERVTVSDPRFGKLKWTPSDTADEWGPIKALAWGGF